MEEVWKDLSLPSHPTAASASAAELTLCGLARQEFLACPCNKDTVSKAESDDRRIISQQERLNTTTRAFGEYRTLSFFNPLKSATGSCACSSRKRGPASDEKASDTKKKRLMKNRESAARSRARQEAYTYQLEAEVARLMQENAMLRKQQEKLCVAALGHQHQQKHKLRRTLTAPF